jgi:Type IV secretion-system coupling protein DNA-binding domain
MKRDQLSWFQLRFPRDLETDAVLAALSSFSGVPHRTRLVFDLSATASSIEHRLAVSAEAMDIVIGSLRAAIPSLRLDVTSAPTYTYRRRLLWQFSPVLAAIRVDELGAIAASLLASLFPLEAHESVHLIWTVRPAVRPSLPVTPESRREGHVQALHRKLALPGLSAHGELLVSASDGRRARQLTQRTTSVLRSLSTPHGRLIHDDRWLGQALRLFVQRGRYFSVAELAAVIGWPVGGPDLPGLELGAAKRVVPSLALPETGRILGTSNFAGVSRTVAITPTASTRGLYLLGPTGTGKTSLIKNLVRDDLAAGRGLAVVETNGDLIRDLCDLIPPHRINDVVLLDPTDPDYAVGFNPLAGSADPSLVADQLGELFQNIWKQFWGPRTGQLAHMALLTLARQTDATLLDLPRLFLDPTFRRKLVAELDDPVGLEPDWRWFDHLPIREQSAVIAPLLNKVRQFTARESIRASIGQATPATSMRELMAEGKVLLVYLPKGLIGAETATLLGCMILTSLWQAATERAALPLAERHSFGLYVDEVQDFASAPIPWDEMFAQGRKYGLALTVAHQNLDQLDRELREVILANARSKAVFALSASDARVMEGLFAPALTAADLQALDAHSVAAQVALDDGATSRPVTLSTPPPPVAQGSAEQVRRSSRERYARLRTEVEAVLRAQVEHARPSSAPVGRRRRVQQ